MGVILTNCVRHVIVFYAKERKSETDIMTRVAWYTFAEPVVDTDNMIRNR